jgi:hypothetical protein
LGGGRNLRKRRSWRGDDINSRAGKAAAGRAYESNFGALLIEGLEEAIAYEHGTGSARTSSGEVTAWDDQSRRLLELVEEFPEAPLGKVHGIR